MRAIWLAVPVLLAGLSGVSWQIWDHAKVQSARHEKITEILTIDSSDICRVPAFDTSAVSAETEGADDLPIDIEITRAFHLKDQHGQRRDKDNLFGGKLSLVFFGYASCEGICLLAIPSIADAASSINEQAGYEASQPVLITIDPKRDTPDFLKSQLAKFSDLFVGLRGPESALQNARRMFKVQSSPVFEDERGTVYQHGSFIFLINGQAEVVSMLPPVLPPERIASIAMKYL